MSRVLLSGTWRSWSVFANSPHLSRNFTSWRLTHLPHRHLLQVRGKDAENLLQGLVTNDIRHLEESSCIFAFFLNHLGRIVCDTFIYKVDRNDLLLEVDAGLVSTVTSHLLKHKLRKDASIKPCEQGQTWALFASADPSKVVTAATELKEWSDGCNFVVANDNRTPFAMARIAVREADAQLSVTSRVTSHIGGQGEVTQVQVLDYQEYRYMQGLSEGPLDHPKDSSFPLECNGDLMQGISFFKGCYIGQELTARTYHTGVIRKRLMPLRLQPGWVNWSPGMDLKSLDAKVTRKVGKVRSICSEKNVALGLVYVSIVQETPQVCNEFNERAHVEIPVWWPKENKGAR